MLRQTILNLSLLAAAATAAPLQPQPQPRAGATSFSIVAHVTDASKELSPPVDGQTLGGVHYGAGAMIPSFGDAPADPSQTSYWYLDAGRPVLGVGSTPYGLNVLARDQGGSSGEHTTSINVGTGSDGLSLADDAQLRFAQPGQWAACVRTLTTFPVRTLLYVYDGEALPEGCAPVELRAKCAPAGAPEHPDQVSCSA